MNDEEAVDLLATMVRIPSVSGEEAELAGYLVESMGRLGFEAYVDKAGNAVGLIGEGVLLGVLLGHMDTVPGEIPVRVEGGRLHGRGAVDAKGPLAAFIAAATRRWRAGSLPGRIAVVGCVEEEVPSSKGAHYAAACFRPSFCVVGEPSGWDGVALGYKGYLRALLRFEQDGGHPAHAGATICEHAVAAWGHLQQAADRWNEGRERIFDRIMLALRAMHSGDGGGQEWSELSVDLRLPLDLSPEEAARWLQRGVSGATIEFRGGLPAWAGRRTTRLHRLFAHSIIRRGGRMRYTLKTGTADLNIVAPLWGCPALAYGPGDAALDHTPGEYLRLTDYLRSIAVLEDVLGGCASVVTANCHAVATAAGPGSQEGVEAVRWKRN
ncbi:MAG: [LysW]-lysine hydrolase [Planctomycetota bacterium]